VPRTHARAAWLGGLWKVDRTARRRDGRKSGEWESRALETQIGMHCVRPEAEREGLAGVDGRFG